MPPLELKLNKPCNDCPYRKDSPLPYTVTFAKLRLNGLEWRLDEIDENTPELYHTVQEMALENYDNTQL